jgi:hypothetical protein
MNDDADDGDVWWIGEPNEDPVMVIRKAFPKLSPQMLAAVLIRRSQESRP